MNDDFYEDELLDFSLADNQDDDADGGHRWDYVEPSEPKKPIPWQVTYKLNKIESAPEKIQQLYDMFSKTPWTITRNKAFYQQAIFMADYNDHAEIVPFSTYFPVYREMTVSQLRSYFTIRTMLRQGKHPVVPISYMFVYIYELLMKIGVNTAEEGLELLEDLRDSYKKTQPKLLNYLDPWIQDYIIYYQITDAIPRYFQEQITEDKRSMALANYAKLSDGLLMETVCQLSNYQIKDAALYKKFPKETTEAIAYCIKRVIPAIETKEHHHIESICYGMRKKKQRAMFATAIFYDPDPVKSATIDISPRRKVYCNNGLWSYDSFVMNAYTKKGEPFGTILHEIDRQLRVALHRGPKINPRMQDLELKNLIHQAIIDLQHEKAEAARPKIQVDFSKLHQIREDAAVVREALLTEEDKIEEQHVETKPEIQEIPQKEIEEQKKVATDSPLTPEEQKFLQLLMDGGDYQSYLRDIHTPAGVMTDTINEKMMDLIGDIAVEDDGNRLAIIEDYIEDIKEMI